MSEATAKTEDRHLEWTLAALDLERLDENTFSAAPEGGSHRLFGGMVGAQSVMAGGRTVAADRKLHSLHAYFLRPGASGLPLRFDILRTREGGSYSTRRITASQEGTPIFDAVASFAADEEGLSHQTIDMPTAPDPGGLPHRERERARRYKEKLGVEVAPYESAVEVRLCDPTVVDPGSREPRQDNWLRVSGSFEDDPLLQRALLVYASDRTLVSTARMPFEEPRNRLISVSLDHAIWFHHDVDIRDWHLCQTTSPAGSHGRGLVLCHIYRSDGLCVATVAQEALVRVRR